MALGPRNRLNGLIQGLHALGATEMHATDLERGHLLALSACLVAEVNITVAAFPEVPGGYQSVGCLSHRRCILPAQHHRAGIFVHRRRRPLDSTDGFFDPGNAALTAEMNPAELARHLAALNGQS